MLPTCCNLLVFSNLFPFPWFSLLFLVQCLSFGFVSYIYPRLNPQHFFKALLELCPGWFSLTAWTLRLQDTKFSSYPALRMNILPFSLFPLFSFCVEIVSFSSSWSLSGISTNVHPSITHCRAVYTRTHWICVLWTPWDPGSVWLHLTHVSLSNWRSGLLHTHQYLSWPDWIVGFI